MLRQVEPKRDSYIFDPSLVLYLPLYELDGGTFKSKDAYGHLCTVSGALWRPNGRCLDGIDDQINTGLSTVLTTFTWQAWIKTALPGTVAYPIAKRHIAHFRVNSDNTLWFSLNAPGGGGGSAANQSKIVQSVDAVNWWNIAAVYNDNTDRKIYLFLNGQEVTYSIQAALTTAIADDISETLRFGSYGNGEIYWGGAIGEFREYNRALTPQEIQQNYLTTKWRYQ